MNIILDGKEYTTEELIAAIQVSDNCESDPPCPPDPCDPEPPCNPDPYCSSLTLESLDGIVQSLLLRMAAVETLIHDRLQWTHDGGHAVATENTEDGIEHTVHVTDNTGRKSILKYTIPHDQS